jgi:hypothetical protein
LRGPTAVARSPRIGGCPKQRCRTDRPALLHREPELTRSKGRFEDSAIWPGVSLDAAVAEPLVTIDAASLAPHG